MGICEAKASYRVDEQEVGLGLGTLLPPSTPSPPPPPTAAPMESLTAAFADLSVREKPEEKSEWAATGGWELGADDSGWNIEPSGWDDDDDELTKDSPAPLENRKDAPRPRPPPPVHYPQRPRQPDCVFYVKSGSCKFGMNCKFNHPAKESARVRRRKAWGLAQVGNGETKVVSNTEVQGLELSSPFPPTSVCTVEPFTAESKNLMDNLGRNFGRGGDQNYTGLIENGNRLKDSLSSKEGKNNGLRFPLRPGKTDCSYYLTTGNCQFGSNCRFNHPPTGKVTSKQTEMFLDAKGKEKNPSEKMEKTVDKVMKGKQNHSLSERKEQKDNKDTKGKKKNPSEKMEKTEDKVMKGKQNQSLSERKDQKDNKDAKGKKKNPSEKMEKTEDKVMKGKQNQSLSERMDQKDNKADKEKQDKTLPRRIHWIERKAADEKRNFSEREEQKEYKHYPVAGDYNATEGCKDGNFQGKVELARVELNFLGLPIRPGEIECPHYMHTGGCKFSTSCRYHHPDPTVVGQDPVLGFHSGGPQQHMSGASAPPMTSWPFPINPSEPVPYFGVGPSYTPGFYPLPPQGLYPNPQWNGYQVPAPVLPWMHPDMNATNFQGSTGAVAGGGINQYPQADEYPDRPGQPECRYFARTGACEFKSACKFHHPAP